MHYNVIGGGPGVGKLTLATFLKTGCIYNYHTTYLVIRLLHNTRLLNAVRQKQIIVLNALRLF